MLVYQRPKDNEVGHLGVSVAAWTETASGRLSAWSVPSSGIARPCRSSDGYQPACDRDGMGCLSVAHMEFMVEKVTLLHAYAYLFRNTGLPLPNIISPVLYKEP
jgi:hypothetical protein